MSALEVQVWSDIACPWCYVGKRRLERALEAVSADVRVRYRAFEIDPAAPLQYPTTPTYAQRLAQKYGMREADAQAKIDHMVQLGEKEGIRFDFVRIRGASTLSAHRLLSSCGDEAALQGRLKELLLRAYFTDGELISDEQALVSLATQAGLDADRARATLASRDSESHVRAEQQRAASLGIHGVPFFVVGRYGVSGAQPPEVLAQALCRALSERSGSKLPGGVGEAVPPR